MKLIDVAQLKLAQQDREFIREAREAIKQGYKVVYTSWW